MTHELLKKRTGAFSRRVNSLTKPLLRSVDTQDEARQLRRAANGVAANYRATGLSRSHAEFTARIGVVLEEADESLGWLDYLLDTGFGGHPDVTALRNEASELRNIFWASYWTARGNDRGGSQDGRRRNRRR